MVFVFFSRKNHDKIYSMLQGNKSWQKSGAGMAMFISALLPALPLDLTYHEKVAKNALTYEYHLEPTEKGYRARLTESKQDRVIHQEMELDSDFGTLYWHYADAVAATEVSARRQGKVILLAGKHLGRNISKSLAIDDYPWNQLFQLGLEQFLCTAQSGASRKFWAIGTAGPGDMRIARFVAKVQEICNIPFRGANVTALHVRITFTGMFRIFWHGDYWFRRSDGRFLRYSDKATKETGAGTSELVAEKLLP